MGALVQGEGSMKKELRIGNMAIKRGLMTPQQVNICLEIQAKLRAYGIELPLGEIAVRRGFIKQEDLESLLHLQTTAKKTSSPETEPEPHHEPEPPTEKERSPLTLPKGVVNTLMGISAVLCFLVWGLFLYRVSQSPKKIIVKQKSPQKPPPKKTQRYPPPKPPKPKRSSKESEEFEKLLALFKAGEDPEKVLAGCADFRRKYPTSKRIKDLEKIEKICRERMENARLEHNRRAGEAFVAVAKKVLRLRGEERLWEAIETLKSFPKEFRDTEYWKKVQEQIRQLQEQIGRRYADDLEELKLCIAREDIKKAEEIVSRVAKYAGKDVAEELRKHIKSAKRPKMEKLTPDEALREVETLFSARRYAEAERIARQYLLKSPLPNNEKTKTLLLRLEAVASLYRLVATYYQMRVGKRLSLPLWPSGRVAIRLEEVHDFTLFGRDESGSVVRVAISELTGDLIESVVAETTKPTPKIELGLAQAWLDRGNAQKASIHIESFLKLGGDGAVVAAMKKVLPKTDDKTKTTPRTIEKAQSLIAKRRYGEALDLLRSFLRTASPELKKSALPLLKTCRKKLSSPKSPFTVEMLKRDDLGRGFYEVTYDFSDERQLNDWKEYNWYSVFDLHNSIWRIERGELRGSGCRGFLWKGYVKGDVIVEFDAIATSRTQPNIQVTICDDAKGKNYLFGAGLVELGPPQDVIRFNQRYGGPRTLAKRPSAVVAFRKYHIRVQKKNSKLTLFIDGKKVLETRATALKNGHVGLFAAGGVVRFDNVRIIGRIMRKIK